GQRGEDQDDVGHDVEDLVDDPAPVAGDEADRHPDDCGDPSAEQPDDGRSAEAVDELGEHVLSERGGAEPVLGRRRGRRAPDVLLHSVVGEPRPDDGGHGEEEHDETADPQLGIAQGEVEELATTAPWGGRGRRRHPFGGGQGGVAGQGVAHAALPCIPRRVRGSTSTYTTSMRKLATSTPATMNKNTPWRR